LLDEVFAEYGVFLEQNASLQFEGAEGAAKIRALVESYTSDPPKTLDGAAVTRLRNYSDETFHDVEGDEIPKENMIIVDLDDGRRVAVRPSGTEPKIKFYMFARREPPAGGRFAADQILEIKSETKASLDRLWQWVRKDAETRLTT